jgi:hypothetical protein
MCLAQGASDGVSSIKISSEILKISTERMNLYSFVQGGSFSLTVKPSFIQYVQSDQRDDI